MDVDRERNGNDRDQRNGGDRYPPQDRRDRDAGGDRGRAESEQANPGNNLHVSGLALDVEARDLEEYFGTIGKVAKASIMHDPHSRASRGFGFVMMETHEDAAAAIAELDKKMFRGKEMTVAMARRARARTPTPGRYFGPPKAAMGGMGGGYPERQYQPRSYDSRYNDRGPPPGRYDDRERYRDDRGPPPSRYADRRYESRGGGGYDDRRAPPPRGGERGVYDDRRARPDDRYERSRY